MHGAPRGYAHARKEPPTHPKKTISGLINAFPSHSLLPSPLSSSSLPSLPSHSSLPTLRFFFGLSSRSRARVAAAASSSGVQKGQRGTREEKTSGSMAVPGKRRRQIRQEAVAKEPVHQEHQAACQLRLGSGSDGRRDGATYRGNSACARRRLVRTGRRCFALRTGEMRQLRFHACLWYRTYCSSSTTCPPSPTTAQTDDTGSARNCWDRSPSRTSRRRSGCA